VTQIGEEGKEVTRKKDFFTAGDQPLKEDLAVEKKRVDLRKAAGAVSRQREGRVIRNSGGKIEFPAPQGRSAVNPEKTAARHRREM